MLKTIARDLAEMVALGLFLGFVFLSYGCSRLDFISSSQIGSYCYHFSSSVSIYGLACRASLCAYGILAASDTSDA